MPGRRMLNTQQGPSLIDELYRATFSKDRVLGMISNADLRLRLQNARRFVLDDEMASFMSDLAFAGFAKLQGAVKTESSRKYLYASAESLRVSARLPHRSTWIEYNLQAAMKRSRELNEPDKAMLTASLDDIPMTEGWLIEQHPNLDYAFRMHMFHRSPPGSEQFDLWAFPVCYGWTATDDPLPWSRGLVECNFEASYPKSGATEPLERSEVLFGLPGYVTDKIDIIKSDLMLPELQIGSRAHSKLIGEWMGVMRRLMALLATINDIPVAFRDVAAAKGFVARGRYRKYLNYRTITLTVPQNVRTRVARKLMAHAKRAGGKVRAHWRVDWRNRPVDGCQHLYNADNRCTLCGGHRLWIHEHYRGDATQAFFVTDYNVTHPRGKDYEGKTTNAKQAGPDQGPTRSAVRPDVAKIIEAIESAEKTDS